MFERSFPSSRRLISPLFFFLFLLVSFLGGCRHLSNPVPITLGSRNVILIIGDGMGPEQVKAASIKDNTDIFEELVVEDP